MSGMQGHLDSSYLFGGSSAYLEDMYEQFLADPNTVPDAWRRMFEGLPSVNGGNEADVSHATIKAVFEQHAKMKASMPAAHDAQWVDVEHERKQAQVLQLIHAFRSHGHHHAKLDPLALKDRLRIPDLELAAHGLSQTDLDTVFETGDLPNLPKGTLREIFKVLNETYAGSIGVEYMHITNQEETQWLLQRIEQVRSKPTYSVEEKNRILHNLVGAEGLEKYLGSKYVGQKRFSLEGGEALIPMMDELIQRAGAKGVKEVAIGMAHRGRLNVLINIVGKSPETLFEEFAGKRKDEKRSGDVKYHMGFSSNIKTPGGPVHTVLAFNPSHLEIIAPVVEGSVRARQERRADHEHNTVLPVNIHGDAAIAGQGIVLETLNMSQARGYKTGGTVHIVINNQVGFTTSNPLDARSTLYCTDVAKMIQAPVFHVNADDPEAVVFVTQLALDYRIKFKKDVMIDLVCYRRHGHNEADEPSGTQPLMYQKIRSHTPVPKLYANQLVKEGVLAETRYAELVEENRQDLDKGETLIEHAESFAGREFSSDWTPYLDHDWDVAYDSSLPKKKLIQLAKRMTALPEGFTLQKQVAKAYADRDAMTAGELLCNWGYAETLAYATLVDEGYKVRLSGQDSGRGTFSHRHAALHDNNTGQTYVPLQYISDEQAPFTVIDSILSEAAVLAFEYGFSITSPEALVIWEAQFGDFANNAQVVIDQFITSGDQKWGKLCGLTMFLPHGYEGMGPEHSSARLERFLQLSAQHNIQVCVPSTPSQIYHLIRRQMVRPFRKPLVVMTPKSLLRHPKAVSTLDELAKGKYELVIDETDKAITPKKAKRLVLCAGKVYYDLLEKREADKIKDIAIIRIEQFYPFPQHVLRDVLKQYDKASEVVWCQEEPKNQGAWYRTLHRIRRALAPHQSLKYAGRADSASPAAGYPSLHNEQQAALLDQALVQPWDKLKD